MVVHHRREPEPFLTQSSCLSSRLAGRSVRNLAEKFSHAQKRNRAGAILHRVPHRGPTCVLTDDVNQSILPRFQLLDVANGVVSARNDSHPS